MLKVKFLVVSLVLLAFVCDTESTWWWRRNKKRSPTPRPYCRPRKCQVYPWSEWSACSYQCGTSGTQTRTRIKTVVEACGGTCPYHLKEIRSCNRDKCQNSGTPWSYGCSCPPGYSGKCCEIAKIVNGKFMKKDLCKLWLSAKTEKNDTWSVFALSMPIFLNFILISVLFLILITLSY